MSTIRSAATVVLVAFAAFAQTPKPKFEVASVKLNTNNGPTDGNTPRRSGDNVIMHNVLLEAVLRYAYAAPGSWLIDGNRRLPDGWNWYDLEAVAPESTSDGDLRLMFQSLLEDRFQVRVHRETREIKGWNLVIGKSGSKLKPATPDSVIAVEGKAIPAGRSVIAGFNDGAHVMGKGVTMEQLANSLSGRTGGPVHDRTGLTGTFDFNVVYSEDSNADITKAPPLDVALSNELGLKLEATKESVEVVVVDHIGKPTPN